MRFATFALVLVLAGALFAQTPTPTPTPTPVPVATFPTQFGGLFTMYNNFSTPAVNGGFVYAAQLSNNNGSPTYSFSTFTITSITKTPFKIMGTANTGVAQYLKSFAGFNVFAIGQIGLATSGSNVGVNFDGGGTALRTQQTKLKGLTWGPLVLYGKTSLGDQQWSVGLLVGFGGK